MTIQELQRLTTFAGGFLMKMAKDKKVEKKEVPHRYKGYDIFWLKEEVNHPDHYLVDEYEKLYGEVK